MHVNLSPPIIGVTSDVKPDKWADTAAVSLEYPRRVAEAGGLAFVIPVAEPSAVPAVLARIDGLLLSGGRDYHPRHFGEELHPKTKLLDERRDAFDVALARAGESGKPRPTASTSDETAPCAPYPGRAKHSRLASRSAVKHRPRAC